MTTPAPLPQLDLATIEALARSIGWVPNPARQRMLRLLAKCPTGATSTEIKALTNMTDHTFSQVSNQLRDQNLVDCYPPVGRSCRWFVPEHREATVTSFEKHKAERYERAKIKERAKARSRTPAAAKAVDMQCANFGRVSSIFNVTEPI